MDSPLTECATSISSYSSSDFSSNLPEVPNHVKNSEELYFELQDLENKPTCCDSADYTTKIFENKRKYFWDDFRRDLRDGFAHYNSDYKIMLKSKIRDLAIKHYLASGGFAYDTSELERYLDSEPNPLYENPERVINNCTKINSNVLIRLCQRNQRPINHWWMLPESTYKYIPELKELTQNDSGQFIEVSDIEAKQIADKFMFAWNKTWLKKNGIEYDNNYNYLQVYKKAYNYMMASDVQYYPDGTLPCKTSDGFVNICGLLYLPIIGDKGLMLCNGSMNLWPHSIWDEPGLDNQQDGFNIDYNLREICKLRIPGPNLDYGIEGWSPARWVEQANDVIALLKDVTAHQDLTAHNEYEESTMSDLD